jgi:hypothetical protein
MIGHAIVIDYILYVANGFTKSRFVEASAFVQPFGEFLQVADRMVVSFVLFMI